MYIYEIDANELKGFINPLDGGMWKCGEISEQEIYAAISSGKTENRPWNAVNFVISMTIEEAREFHINRIATLLDSELTEHIIVVLENHTPSIKAYLNDGNHRLAAAYLRGDKTIKAVIAASDPNKISSVLPSAKQISL